MENSRMKYVTNKTFKLVVISTWILWLEREKKDLKKNDNLSLSMYIGRVFVES